MKTDHGIDMPKEMQAEFSSVVQAITDSEGGEVNSKNMWDVFAGEYLDVDTPLELVSLHVDAAESDDDEATVTAGVVYNGETKEITGSGNGPIAAFASALRSLGLEYEVRDYRQQARTAGGDADAACFIYSDVDGSEAWGVGIAGSTTRASIKAMVSAVNRGLKVQQPLGQ